MSSREARVPGSPDRPAVGAATAAVGGAAAVGDEYPTDATGLDLARSLAGRIAAAAGPPGRWRRRSSGSTNAPDGTAGRVPARQAAAPGRVGGLADTAPFTGPGPDRHDPAVLGSALRDLVTARGWAQRTDASAVLARWSDLVGEATAAHCQPVELDEGRLRVRADSSTWATQVRLLAPQIVETVNTRVGSAVVTELVVDGPAAPSWRHGRLGVQGGRGPRDTYG